MKTGKQRYSKLIIIKKFSCSTKIKYDDYIRIIFTLSFIALKSSFSFCYLLLSQSKHFWPP